MSALLARRARQWAKIIRWPRAPHAAIHGSRLAFAARHELGIPARSGKPRGWSFRERLNANAAQGPSSRDAGHRPLRRVHGQRLPWLRWRLRSRLSGRRGHAVAGQDRGDDQAGSARPARHPVDHLDRRRRRLVLYRPEDEAHASVHAGPDDRPARARGLFRQGRQGRPHRQLRHAGRQGVRLRQPHHPDRRPGARLPQEHDGRPVPVDLRPATFRNAVSVLEAKWSTDGNGRRSGARLPEFGSRQGRSLILLDGRKASRARRNAASGLPILDPQSRHAAEFVSIVSDQGQVACDRLSGDEHVVGADRRPLAGQQGAYLAGLPCILLVEVEDDEAERVDEGDIPVRLLALERAIEKLMRHDGGDRHVAGLHSPRTLRRLGGDVVQKRDDDIRVQEIAHQSNSLSSAGRSWGSGCSLTARTKSSSSRPATESSQLQSLARGSRMTAGPWRRIRTSSPSKRKSFGSRTACDRPLQNILAVSIGAPQCYISKIYIAAALDAITVQIYVHAT